MPHVSEVRATDHDRHDPMLVAALAAGDLAGTDRDQAIALTTSCAECAALHDDLVAIARATATVPPPIRARRPRLPAHAGAGREPPADGLAALRAAPAVAAPFTRPLGVGPGDASGSPGS